MTRAEAVQGIRRHHSDFQFENTSSSVHLPNEGLVDLPAIIARRRSTSGDIPVEIWRLICSGEKEDDRVLVVERAVTPEVQPSIRQLADAMEGKYGAPLEANSLLSVSRMYWSFNNLDSKPAADVHRCTIRQNVTDGRMQLHWHPWEKRVLPNSRSPQNCGIKMLYLIEADSQNKSLARRFEAYIVDEQQLFETAAKYAQRDRAAKKRQLEEQEHKAREKGSTKL